MDEDKDSLIEGQLARLKSLYKVHSDTDLAKKMGKTQSAISSAKIRGRVPSTWIVDAVIAFGVNLAWVATGEGPMKPGVPSPEAGEDLTAENQQYINVHKRYLEMRIQAQDERLELYEKLVRTLERENAMLLKENTSLQAQIKELSDQRSLSPSAKRESAQGNTA